MGLLNAKQVKEDISKIEKDRLAETQDKTAIAEIQKNTDLLNKLTDNVHTAVSLMEKQQLKEKSQSEYDKKLKNYEETIVNLMTMVMKLDNENKQQEARLKELEKRTSVNMEKRVNEIAEHIGDSKDAGKILGRSMYKAVMMGEQRVHEQAEAAAAAKAKSRFRGAVKQVIKKNEKEKSVMDGFMDSGYEEDSLDNKEVIKRLMNLRVQASVVKVWQDVVKTAKAAKK